MKCIGIAIKKNEVWYSVVDGVKMEEAVLFDSGKQIFQADDPIPSLMMKFSNIFTELITKYVPDRIAYKLSLRVDMSQIPYMHFSLGVLNLLCMQNNVPSRERSSQWITAGKKVKILKCEDHFSSKKFRNSDEMQATLIAWFEMGK